VEFDFYKATKGPSANTLIFIGGDGDVKDDFTTISLSVQKDIPNINVCTTTFE